MSTVQNFGGQTSNGGAEGARRAKTEADVGSVGSRTGPEGLGQRGSRAEHGGDVGEVEGQDRGPLEAAVMVWHWL